MKTEDQLLFYYRFLVLGLLNYNIHTVKMRGKNRIKENELNHFML